MTTTSELTGKLDATASVVANGPEGLLCDWRSVDWPRVEEQVRRLRYRIFTASRDGDLKKVRSLQKLMLRSQANALVAVRRVTELNVGRATAGIDGKTVLLASAKAELAAWVQSRSSSWTARPVRRVFIPKANGKQRPLGIPVIVDRAVQAVVLNALEPEWEARFEPRSYGFRPGRGCHDAIEAIFAVAKGRTAKRLWILDADLTAAFDRIDHDRLLAKLGTFPARELVRQWLKAGVIDRGRFAPTEAGTPQGGVISPLLLNVALHGMEHAAGVRYRIGAHLGHTALDAPVLIRYADDFVVMCHSREQAIEVKAKLADWLAPRGMTFNEDKTRIVHLNEGFDFLGFNARKYQDGKLLIKPSPAAVKRFRKRLRTEVRSLRGANIAMVIARLNPILRGWAAYYRAGVSKHVFNDIDDYLWWLMWRWASFRHPNKARKWITSRYLGMFNPARRARWLFGDRDTGAYLTKIVWTPIVRHRVVDGDASPDDPSKAEYWALRRRRTKPPIGRETLAHLRRQHGRCPRCGDFLLYADTEPQHPDDWEKWIVAVRRAIRRQAITRAEPSEQSDHATTQLVHTYCAQRRRTP